MGKPIQKLFTDNKLTEGTTYVGQRGRLWYDPNLGLRVSDGTTPGGVPAVVYVSTASIGDLVIAGSSISSINVNENITLQSNGTGEIIVVGSFQINTPIGQNILEISNTGEVSFLAPIPDNYNAAFTITGNGIGSLQNPQNTGVLLQLTAQQGSPARIYNDGIANYAAYIGRRYNGTSQFPSAVLSGETISRIGATPYTSSGWPSISTSRIDFVATENQSSTNQGNKITFWATSTGSNSIQNLYTMDSNGIYPSSTSTVVDLGSSTNRWGNIWVGPHSLRLQDQTLLTDVALTVNNGTLYLNGAQNIALGELTIVGNTIQAITPSTQINLGDLNDTALFNIGRPTLLQSPNFASTTSLLTIAGSTATGVALTNAGTMIHVINQAGQSSRIINDSYGTGLYPVYAGRSARGTINNPTSTSATDILSRFGANGYVAGVGTGTGFLSLGSARIDFRASEDFTPTNRGTQIDFYTTPKGSTTLNNVASISDTGLITDAITFSADGSVQTSAGIPANTVGISNGIAQLGGDGKLLSSQIPSSLQGAVTFAGGWNASTNTPNLANNTSTYSTGTEFVITQGGTQNLGAGSVNYQAGGFVIYGGGVWNYAPGVSNFTSISAINHISVNTATGVIQVTSDATPNNTTATIVARDNSGNFQANTITANLSGNVTGNVTGSLTGNAQTASKLNSAVSINGVQFDGSANIQVNNTSTLTFGTGLNTGSYNGSAPVTVTLNTATLMANAVNAQTATTSSFATTATYAQSFNTSTLVTTAVNANTVTNGYVSSITAGTGTTVSSSNGAVTVSTTATLQTINTWTPSLLFATQGTVSYSTRIGNYIKVGQHVTAFFSITITSYGTSSGNASIGGLPFLSENVTGVVGALNVTSTPTLATQAVMSGSMTGNTSTVALECYTETFPPPINYGPATAAILGGTASFSGFITYISAT